MDVTDYQAGPDTGEMLVSGEEMQPREKGESTVSQLVDFRFNGAISKWT